MERACWQGIDGHELIARLRNDERTNQTPIIVLTACAWNTERERAERTAGHVPELHSRVTGRQPPEAVDVTDSNAQPFF